MERARPILVNGPVATPLPGGGPSSRRALAGRPEGPGTSTPHGARRREFARRVHERSRAGRLHRRRDVVGDERHRLLLREPDRPHLDPRTRATPGRASPSSRWCSEPPTSSSSAASPARRPGKIACGIQVRRYDGSTLGPLPSLARGVLGILGIALLGIGIWPAFWDKDRRGLHDRATDSRVTTV